ncbi:MAG: 16S rRNA (adenine(1518)-N(6)/adenine(1519)-N(6))-dimethyltransferase, partial [Minisyncoccia bacterium]
RILKAGFSQPRKLLISNLQKTLKIEKNKIIDAVLKINIPLNSRSQNLSLKDWQNLTNLLLS